MALFDTKTAAAPKAGAAKEERAPSQFWLNIGLELEVPVEGGGTEKKFISFAGVALDNLEPMAVRGQNPIWALQVQAKNAMLDFAQKTAAGLEAGQGDIIENFQVQVFRRNPSQEATGTETANPLLAQIAEKGFKLVG